MDLRAAISIRVAEMRFWSRNCTKLMLNFGDRLRICTRSVAHRVMSSYDMYSSTPSCYAESACAHASQSYTLLFSTAWLCRGFTDLRIVRRSR